MNHTDTTTNQHQPTDLRDPRPDFIIVASAFQALLDNTGDHHLIGPTPCEGFDVQTLLDHVDMVFRRFAAVGRGEHWSSVEQVRVGETVADYVASISAAASTANDTWADPQLLDRMLEVPWATMPGAAVVASYTGELAIHSWDLARATDQEFEIGDDHLAGALFAWKMIPAEGRETPEIPFGPVVDPGADASALAQLAGWAGRPVV